MTITFTTVCILILIGLFSGMLSGLIGVGGGVIIVPCLIYFLAFTQKMAQGTSLAVLTLPVVILGMLQYYKQGHVDFRLAFLVAIGFAIGSFFGGKLAVSLPDATLKKIFAVILILIATKILFFENNNISKNNTNNLEKTLKS